LLTFHWKSPELEILKDDQFTSKDLKKYKSNFSTKRLADM